MDKSVFKDSEIDEIRKQIPRERYDFQKTASESQRHRRRAEEIQDPELKAFHVKAAEEHEAIEKELAYQLDQRSHAIESEREYKVEKALILGPTKRMQIAWKIADIRAKSGPVLRIIADRLTRAVTFLFSKAGLISATVSGCITFYMIDFCYYYGLGFELLGFSAAVLIPAAILIIYWFGQLKLNPKRSRRGFHAWCLNLTAIVCCLFLLEIYHSVLTPMAGLIGVEVKNGKVIQVINTTLQDHMRSPKSGSRIDWYDLTPIKWNLQAKYQGIGGSMSVTVYRYQRMEVLSQLVSPVKTSDQYREAMQALIIKTLDETIAKHGSEPLGPNGEMKIGYINDALMALPQDDICKISKVDIYFYPDHVQYHSESK